MIVEFHDRKGQSDHESFREWRTSHCCDENGENERDGYFLASQKSNQAELHSWDCRQRSAGGSNWDEFFGSHPTQPPSMTRTRKVCSDDKAELLAWADSNQIQVSFCAHCLNQIAETSQGVVIAPIETPQAENNPNESIQAIEGIARETTIITRSRSESLRRAALERARGICDACGTDYSKLAGGLGKRVLQVHHRRQLALTEEPVTNGLDDLAVVCANCHLMVHADISNALSIEELRQRLVGGKAS